MDRHLSWTKNSGAFDWWEFDRMGLCGSRLVQAYKKLDRLALLVLKVAGLRSRWYPVNCLILPFAVCGTFHEVPSGSFQMNSMPTQAKRLHPRNKWLLSTTFVFFLFSVITHTLFRFLIRMYFNMKPGRNTNASSWAAQRPPLFLGVTMVNPFHSSEPGNPFQLVTPKRDPLHFLELWLLSIKGKNQENSIFGCSAIWAAVHTDA